MTRPFALQYVPSSITSSRSRRRRRLSVERLEEIAAANSLQDLLLFNLLANDLGNLAPPPH